MKPYLKSKTKLRPLSLLPLFAFLVLFCGVSFAQNDDDIVTVDSSIVLVNVTILDRSGKTVGGLTEKQFKIFEDGVEQKIESFAAEETPFAAVILMDTSGSMESRVSIARSAAIKFLEGLRIDDNAAIYHFHSKVELVQDFSNSRDIVERIFDLKADGMTVLNDAVFKAAELLAARKEKRRAIIVLSDGADTQSKRSQDKALKAANAAGATIYTIDMSSPDATLKEKAQNQSALKSFAEKTGGTFVATPGGNGMRDAFKRIVEELGNQYTLAYSPKDAKKDGKFHSIEVTVSRPNLTLRTRKGYNAPKQK
ncbi:MAG: VWA domain-containing protein [Pyrinomonadaceae bacterium]|nr:VWA domain-containing protein [Pyrinomonadaceae bacterium]